MSNHLIKRKFKTVKELEQLTIKYFEEEPYIMIETYYEYIGIRKHDPRNWKKSETLKMKKWVAIIDEAKERIHNHLARVVSYGQNAQELDANKVVKSKGNGSTTWEFNKANQKALSNYLKSRYKDDWEKDDSVDTGSKVVINIGNEGPNTILGTTDKEEE